MAILTADTKRLIAEQKLDFVETVNADGTPNLSPKGTMQALDDARIISAAIRSPGTMANIARYPASMLFDRYCAFSHRHTMPSRTSRVCASRTERISS